MPPPLAVSVVLCPAHIVVVPEMAGVGNGFTVTNCEVLAVQPGPFVMVTV